MGEMPRQHLEAMSFVSVPPAYRRRARYCGVVSILIGISGLLGWIFSLPVLNSVIPGYKPIAISMTVITIILGVVQVLIAWARLPRWAGRLLLGITLFVALFGLLQIVNLLTGANVSIENAILAHYPALNRDPNVHISPVASVLSLLIALGQSLYLYQWLIGRPLRALTNILGTLGSLIILGSAVFILSYIYRTPLLYGTIYIPIALLATIATLLLGGGLLLLAGNAAFPLVWFVGTSTRARLLRAFLPLTAGMMLLLSVVQFFIVRLTHLNPATTAAVLIILFEMVVTAVVLQVARTMGNMIDRAEAERRHAEEKLRQLNDTLEQRVHARTAELEASNKELEAFSYSVAHDLRSPLRAMDGYSKFLLERHAEHLDEQSQHYLHRIRIASQRMGRLIDDLLHLARIGRTAMTREPVDLSALAAAIVAELRQRDPARQVEVDIAPGMTVQADPELLRTALTHLLDNAWKFTGKRADARIEVGTLSVDGGCAYYVRDNGVGFAMAYVNKLFHAFQRLHTEEEFPGTGIGLAMVQRILQRHGGRIWAEGEVGQGATFYFTIGEESQ